MNWLLFLNESGRDHKTASLEVRGEVAIPASKLRGFIQAWQRLERDCFRVLLSVFVGEAARGAAERTRRPKMKKEANFLVAPCGTTRTEPPFANIEILG